jgi:LysM repeat protein
MAEFDAGETGLRNAKIGKVPIWVVAVVISAAVILFVVVRSKFGPKTTVNPGVVGPATDGFADPTLSDSSSYGLPQGPIGSYLGNDPINPAYPVGLTTQGLPGPVTNQQWARLSAENLIAKGDDPTLVSNALSKFISGASLSTQEQAIVDLALTMEGQPPEGVIPIQVVTGSNSGSGTGSTSGSGTPAPAAKPTTVTPRRKVIVGVFVTKNPPWNSYLQGIANHYGVSVSQLQSINHIANPNLIYPGQTIWIDPA